MKKSCFDYALYLLKYPKTEKQLKVRLMEKGYSIEEINKTVEKLKNLGFINDEKYAQIYFEEKLKKGYSPYVIKQMLMKKGISKDIILSLNTSDEVIKENIKNIAKKLKKKGKDPIQIITYLQRKGYSLKDIKKSLD